MKKFYVYVHVCPNGKRYVGCTTQKPEYRWGRNGEGYQHQLFGRAILKHGWDNIAHEVFEVDSREEMYRKEVELISFYHSNDPRYGYNCSTGGEKSALGHKHSEEARKHMSEAQKKIHSDPEYREKISETLKERYLDPEYRRKQSEVQKKVHSDPEYLKKLSEAQKKIQKKVHSDPEYLKKLSEAQKKIQKKVHSDPEYLKKQSEVAKNRPKVKISLPDGTVLEMTKQNLTRHYINKGRKFEYLP